MIRPDATDTTWDHRTGNVYAGDLCLGWVRETPEGWIAMPPGDNPLDYIRCDTYERAVDELIDRELWDDPERPVGEWPGLDGYDVVEVFGR